jgi:hypothetical protein
MGRNQSLFGDYSDERNSAEDGDEPFDLFKAVTSLT